MAAPSARGLFHKAISQSAFADGMYPQAEAKESALKILAHMGLSEETAYQLADKPDSELLETSDWMIRNFTALCPGRIAAGPVVDRDILPEIPVATIGQGCCAGIPLLIGTNLDEATMFMKKDLLPWFPDTEEKIERLFDFNCVENKNEICRAYSGYPKKKALARLCGDFSFQIHNASAAQGQSRFAPVWAYRFDYVTPMAKLMGLGAFHSSEIVFVFANLENNKLLRFAKKNARRISSLMHNWWINFASTAIRTARPGIGRRTASRIRKPWSSIKNAVLNPALRMPHPKSGGACIFIALKIRFKGKTKNAHSPE